MRFDGKVALVTGGASGIGQAAAVAFAREGARVAIGDIADDGGRETHARVTNAGGECLVVRANLSREEGVERLLEATLKKFGRIDCAFNNAGISGSVRLPMDEWPLAELDRVLQVNLWGVWHCMRQQLRQMVRQGGGAIVNTASIGGLVGVRGASGYVASKHAVIGLTKTAAIEYAPHGIRVNAVCPGYIETPMLAGVLRANPPRAAELSSLQPSGRLGTPEEIAEAALWLCSDAASFVNGHAMVVDGGVLAQSEPPPKNPMSGQMS